MKNYDVCPECGAVAHGNLFCNTCRTEQNKFYTKMGWQPLPPWDYPAEKPCGVEEVNAFLRKLEAVNLNADEMLVGVRC